MLSTKLLFQEVFIETISSINNLVGVVNSKIYLQIKPELYDKGLIETLVIFFSYFIFNVNRDIV
jgi:hypothetical protein